MIEEAVVGFLGEQLAKVFFVCMTVIVFANISCGSFYFWLKKNKNL